MKKEQVGIFKMPDFFIPPEQPETRLGRAAGESKGMNNSSPCNKLRAASTKKSAIPIGLALARKVFLSLLLTILTLKLDLDCPSRSTKLVF
jgi:hypothetical protein